MLGAIRAGSSARKLRLFAVACVRRVSHLPVSARGLQALKVAERHADGAASAAEWEEFVVDMEVPPGGILPLSVGVPGDLAAVAAREAWAAAGLASMHAASLAAAERAASALPDSPGTSRLHRHLFAQNHYAAGFATERAAHCELLRCLIGNPFRRVTFDPPWLAWREGLLTSTARRMYDARDFGDMGVLADMLEDAGCREEKILGHCRRGGHARGCFVVDGLLGKS
jgi:hypothetical protein